jgi:hypothetical protein
MASFTQADIDRLRAAYVALVAGEAAQTVSFAGPPSRSVTYHPADVERLERILAHYDRTASGASACVQIITDKGLA